MLKIIILKIRVMGDDNPTFLSFLKFFAENGKVDKNNKIKRPADM